MAFWADVLALAPAVLWKLDEASGTVAADSSGNSRPGTYASGFTYAQPSIIPAEVSTCVSSVGNASIFVTRNNEAWMNPGTSFTAMITAQPSTVAVTDWRSLIGKQDSWQFWMMNGGRLQAHITPAWNSFLSSDNAAGKLVAGVSYLIFLRQDATAVKASIWINGVKVGEIAKSNVLANSAGQLQALGAVAGGGRSFPGKQQGFAYWPGVALTDAQIVALYASWSTLAFVAADPGPFTNPVSAQVVDQGITAAWGASGEIGAEYELEYWGGSAWVPIVDELIAVNYDWDASLLAENAAAKLRVRASFGGGVSSWVESDTFQILHLSAPVWNTPTAAGGPYVDEIVADWDHSVSPDLGLADYYEVQVWDGFSWFDLPDVVLSGFDWDSHTRVGTGVKLRIRGVLAAYTTAWVESETFELLGGFALDYWRALLNDIGDIEGLWKGDWLTQGPDVGIDVSGNDRHGYVTMDMFSQPTIINNSNELSIGRDNPDLAGATDLGINVTVDDPIWDITDFTMFTHFNIETRNIADAIVALNNRVYARVNTAGTGLELMLQPGFNLVAAGSLPVATDSYLVVTKKGDLITLYLDGVRIVDTSIVINVVGTGLFAFEGHSGTFQGVGYISRALDALEIAWLNAKSLEAPNLPPTAPGAFFKPTTAGGPYDHSIAMEWGASVDPEGDTLEYQVEFTPDGGTTWTLLYDWAIGTTRTWNTNGIFATIQGKLRVRARDFPYEHVTAWVESETFTILHPRVGVNAPIVFVTYRGYENVGLAVINGLSTGYPISHIIVESKRVTEAWTAPNVSSQIVDEAFYETRFFHVVRQSQVATGVEPTLLDVRVATVDKGGNQSVWTEFEFKPRWIYSAVGGDLGLLARDSSGNDRHGEYSGWVFTAEFIHAEEAIAQIPRAPVSVMLKNPPRQNEPESQVLSGLGWVKEPGDSLWILHRVDPLTENLYSVDWPTNQLGRTFSMFAAFHIGAYLHTNFWSTSWGASHRRDLLSLGKAVKVFVDSDTGLGMADPDSPEVILMPGIKILEDTLLRVLDYNTHEDVTNDFSILSDGLLFTTIDTTDRVFHASWSRVFWLLTKSGGNDEVTYGAAQEHAIHTVGFVRNGTSHVNRLHWNNLDFVNQVTVLLTGGGSEDHFFSQIFNDSGASANLGDYQMGGFPIEFAVWKDYELSIAEYDALRVAANNGAETVPEVMATLPTPHWWYRFMDPDIPAKPVLTGGFVP